MANRASPFTPELKTFQAADDAWSTELRAVFGKDASAARYQSCGHGDEGSNLRSLHDAREAARTRWLNSAY